MTFLKWSMLLGLAALVIPILIHLLNRRRPRPIEWGAMQFLLASVVARSRRVRIEEIILLCLRCLTLAFLALSMARPFLPTGSAIPWALTLPGALLAAIGLGVATVLWGNHRLRTALLWTAGVLLAVTVLSAAIERWVQARRWLTGTGGRDVAIVLDASLSMNLAVDGKSNFARAADEARALVRASRRGDALAVILAGPSPRALVARPTSDRRELLRALDGPDCRPAGGTMAVLEALNMAAALLADGPNADKAVVMISDGHAAGWDTQAETRWKFMAEGLKSLPVTPRVICRQLPLPPRFRNAAIADVMLSRTVIGTDRPVKIEVKVMNSGTEPLQPSGVEFLVDGAKVERTPVVKDLLPQVAEVFHYEYRFSRPGYHVLRAQVAAEDDLPADNAQETVVRVLDRLPVLIVEGGMAERFFFRRASGFVTVALTPREEKKAEKPPAGPDDALDPAEPEMDFLVDPTVMAPSDVAKVTDFGAYRVVVLADVPRLPSAVANSLAAFVKDGGGLLVLPGARAEREFYNQWATSAGEPVAPALLGARQAPAEALRLDARSFSHPALRLVADTRNSDAELGLVSSYATLEADPQSPLVRVGARLEGGAPLLAERQLGKGYVLMTAVALDRRDSNLPSLKCFVPLVHEMIYHLAAPMMAPCNLKAGTEWVADGTPTNRAALARPENGTAQVVSPSGRETPAEIVWAGDRCQVRFADTREPGLFRVKLPAALAPALGAASNATPEIPFTVRTQPEESSLTLLSDNDLAAIRRHVNLFLPESREDLLMAFAGEVPGQELWRVLAVCALLTILGETALLRWIALERHFHEAEPISLHSPAESIRASRDRLLDLVREKGR